MAGGTPVVLVAGASTGIGRAAARALVDAGYEVVGTSRRASGAAPLQGVTFVDLDVADDDSATRAVEGVIERPSARCGGSCPPDCSTDRSARSTSLQAEFRHPDESEKDTMGNVRGRRSPTSGAGEHDGTR